MSQGIPIYFTEKDIPDVFEMLRDEDSIIKKLLVATFIDGGKKMRCPMNIVECD